VGQVDQNLKRRSSARLHTAALATILAVFGNAFVASEYTTRPAESGQNQDDVEVIEQIPDLPGSPGPLADSCGNPPDAELPAPQTPIFEGLYPIALPAVSLLGARNDLPNPFDAGAHWGSLPDGRVWGSTAGISRAPDGTIWAIDRCGQTGAGGTTCLDSELHPILQFDQSGAVLQQFGEALIVSPHKITVSPDGNVWVADNGRADEKGQVVLKWFLNLVLMVNCS